MQCKSVVSLKRVGKGMKSSVTLQTVSLERKSVTKGLNVLKEGERMNEEQCTLCKLVREVSMAWQV